jgi:hypothetical protein
MDEVEKEAWRMRRRRQVDMEVGEEEARVDNI